MRRETRGETTRETGRETADHREEKRIANQTATAYDAIYGSLLAYVRRWGRICSLVEAHARTREARILEVGCGTASFLAEMEKRGHTRLYGCDLSARTLELARRKAPGARLAAADMLAMPYRDGSIDLVIFMGSLHHVEELEEALREGFRALRDSGTLLIFEGDEDFFAARPALPLRIFYKILRRKNAGRKRRCPIDPDDPQYYSEHHRQRSERDYIAAAGPFGTHRGTARFEVLTAVFEGVLFTESRLDRWIYAMLARLDAARAKRPGRRAQMLLAFHKRR